MWFSKHPALSPAIITELEKSLAVMKAEKLKVEEPEIVTKNRKFDFEKAARFFVDRLPTAKEMSIHMSCTKMCVYNNMKRPEMINAVRSLGYDGKVTLRMERSYRDKSSHNRRRA